MNNKGINLEKFKNYIPDKSQVDLIENLAENYKDMSDDDIFVEIIKINSEMEEEMTKEQYEEIFEKLDSIRPLLSDEQNAKLNKVLKMLYKG